MNDPTTLQQRAEELRKHAQTVQAMPFLPAGTRDALAGLVDTVAALVAEVETLKAQLAPKS